MKSGKIQPQTLNRLVRASQSVMVMVSVLLAQGIQAQGLDLIK
jgi:hypothetical protein